MIRPKKSLGQNFLIDNNVINKIINLSSVKDSNIVEIGPGTGNLSKQIINQNPKSFILIEKDHHLTERLKKDLVVKKNIKIFNQDILKFSLEDNIEKNSIIIGNLPYNISSQILVKLIKFKKWLPKYKRLILMFQKEVADKIIAKSKSKNFGRITILTNARLKVTDHFNVSPNSFYPIPKVRSTVLAMEPITNNDFKVNDISNLEKITHVFFSKKRKMINKAFKTLFSNSNLMAERIGIDLSLRPNQLTEKDYYKITECYEKNLKI
jgi:16S rRNA (adenine1518-N6/adenine1519-N6)-dimethyltransferase